MKARINIGEIVYQRQRGMSILETAIVALIIAILLGISIPIATQTLNAYRANSAVQQIAEELSGARSLAMARNRDTTIVFNASSGTYGYDFNNDGLPDSSDPSSPNMGYPIQTLSGARIIFPGGNNISVTFNSRGELPIGVAIPTGQQGLRVQVETSGGNTASVWINLRGKVWTSTP